MNLLARCTIAAIALFASASAVSADYFQGKTVKILVNFPAGGPSDIEARIIARYLGRHIAGHPTVVTVNMGGAGGLIATNYMGEIVPNDSTQVSFFTWNPLAQILGDPALRVGYHKFRMVAGFRQPAIVYVRRDVKPGLKQSSDLLAAERFIVGALAPNTHTTLRSALAFDLLGLKYKMVTGYPGLKDVELAVLKGEVQAASTSLAGYTGSIEPSMVKEGIVLPVFQFDVEDSAGRFAPSDALPNIPTFLDLYRMKIGTRQLPTGGSGSHSG
jgi:tripartite-type tricarboxylate transporter receptor subunit TctC